MKIYYHRHFYSVPFVYASDDASIDDAASSLDRIEGAGIWYKHINSNHGRYVCSVPVSSIPFMFELGYELSMGDQEMMRNEWSEIDSWWGYIEYDGVNIIPDVYYDVVYEREVWG